MPKTFCLAHLSDPHLTSLSRVRARELLNKRLLGYLSWWLHRRHEHRFEVLETLVTDLKAQHPDHIAITGDLTHLGLKEELRQAAEWLAQLGPPTKVTVVPGNHDRYIAVPQEPQKCWQAYSANDGVFPLLREQGPLILIGVDSALPSAPFLATGKVGKEQLERLKELLKSSAHSERCRVLLIHHPPYPEAVVPRKRLLDHAALCQLLAEQGCGLVLHGHSHRWQLHWLKGPKTPIPAFSVPSASAWGIRPGSVARYHLYRFTRTGKGFKIAVEIRSFCPSRQRFFQAGQIQLEVAG
jgi:3',5'-cyclic AMP phosphodiesterase CpdA